MADVHTDDIVHHTMNDLPSVAELKQAAEAGQRITPEDVSVISQVESGLTGRGPIRGGPAGRDGVTD